MVTDLLLLAQGRAEQGCLFGGVLDPCRLEVASEPAVEVMADGGLPLLASLFPKPQNPLRSLVLEVPAPQPGHGANPAPV